MIHRGKRLYTKAFGRYQGLAIATDLLRIESEPCRNLLRRYAGKGPTRKFCRLFEEEEISKAGERSSMSAEGEIEQRSKMVD
jgi:hypothetical protein